MLEGAKKGASTVVGKVGNLSLNGRLSGEELAQYGKLLVRACDSSVHVDDLIVHFATTSRGHTKRLALESLTRLSSMLHTMVVLVMLSDVRELLGRYIRKTRKSYARRFAVAGPDDDDDD